MKFLLLLLLATSAFAETKPKTENLVNISEVIWGFDFLTDGRIIFTQRVGRMSIFDPKTKKVTNLEGMPKVYNVGQGGALDVRVHKGLIYFTYSEAIGILQTTSLGVARLEGEKLVEFKRLFTALEPNDNDIHFGSRIEFDQDNHIFMSVGDRDNRERAQSLAYHQGKMIRLNLDGSVPKDNPYVGVKDARSEIWSLGHRSPQGLMFRPGTTELWEAEMGPRGGDEINVIEAKSNYGWPEVTYGREYHGPKIGTKEKPGFVQPVHYWVPSISPSALTFHKGDLYLATLSSTHIHKMVLEGRKVVKEEKLLQDLDYRFRNLRTGPDGHLYYSTDEGKLGRITF